MAVKTGVVDENGPPAGIPTRLSRIKNKLVMLKTQGAASLLNEVSGKRDDDGLAPLPQSDLSLDLKVRVNPRSYDAVALSLTSLSTVFTEATGLCYISSPTPREPRPSALLKTSEAPHIRR